MIDFEAYLEMCRDQDQPTCPYCHRRDDEWWDTGLYEHAGDGDWHVVKCPQCEKKYETSSSLSWTSQEIEDDNEPGDN